MQPFRDYAVRYRMSDAEVVSLYLSNPHRKVLDLVAESGRSLSDFYRALRDHHVPPGRYGVNRDNVLILAATGMDLPQIAQATGYSLRNVRYILERHKKGA